jgi:hypothetical protein
MVAAFPDETIAGLPQGLFDAACEGMRAHEKEARLSL